MLTYMARRAFAFGFGTLAIGASLHSAATRDRVTIEWYDSWIDLRAAPLAKTRYTPDATRYRGEEVLRYNYFSNVVYDVRIVDNAQNQEGTMRYSHVSDGVYDVQIVREEPEPFAGLKFVRANSPEPQEPVRVGYSHVNGSPFLSKWAIEPPPKMPGSALTAREYHTPQSIGAFCTAWMHEERPTLNSHDWMRALREALGDADGKRIKVTYRRRMVPSDFVPDALRRAGCALGVVCRDLSHPPIITPARGSSCPFQEPR